jgi:hypothetical protein
MRPLRLLALSLALLAAAAAQDASTAGVRGIVRDSTGAVIAGASVTAQRAGTGYLRETRTGSAGEFALLFLPPDEYSVRVEAPGMAPAVRAGVRAEVGATVQLDFALRVGGANETVSVSAEPVNVETAPNGLTTVIGAQEIAELPLNGRRWQDAALHAPAVTQDPRGLTSSWNGDLAFGGVRGYQSTFLVDGVDNTNSFFGQARGRYRAPYQLSSEVVQEFRVSSNTYGVEVGRSSGAVVNVVTKSGTNQLHGSAFYYLRSSDFGARNPFVVEKPPDHQHQFGFTLGGKVARDRAYFYLGADLHFYHTPVSVRFLDGSSVLVPKPTDYEITDQAQVFAAADQLTGDLAGDFRSQLLGNTAFVKFDYTFSPRHALAGRINTSRYNGANNVFFDPASPLTNRALSNNGTEEVATESATLALTSSLPGRLVSLLRVQFSRDLQQSHANTDQILSRIDEVIEGFGRSTILPRRTREHKFQFAETLSLDTPHHTFKFGGDMLFARIENFFPLLAGGEYIFDTIRVNPFTFAPATFGLRISPLRAYAHGVPRFYIQNFGALESHPDTSEFSLFAQDNIRVTPHLAITLGLRWDLQTFNTDGLAPNPLWPGSGRIPVDTNNVAPRVAFAWSIGEKDPFVLRGGYGIFYTRIPQIYTSAVETDNGLKQTHLFLDNADFFDQALFPDYPAPLVTCPPTATQCQPPPGIAGKLESEIATFAEHFQTPYVQQASLTAERDLWNEVALGVSYLYVHGTHLVRTRDVNLPPPNFLTYPVYDEAGNFTGQYFTVASFATWQLTPSLSCPFNPPFFSPPCINDIQRPIPQVGAIDQFESAVSSVYHGLTVSARRRMRNGLFFRVSYTWAKAIDDGQDAPFTAPPAVQNSAQPSAERSVSSIDQRQRFVAAWVWAPNLFDREQPLLKRLFNDWTIAGTVTYGSGRPFNARILGDANRDTNSSNDRLPGRPRNAFYGPDYLTTDLRLTRRLFVRDRITVDLLVESFNVMNRPNKRLTISDNDFQNSAGRFVFGRNVQGGTAYPAQYETRSGFLEPTNAYAPRQAQLGVKVKF